MFSTPILFVVFNRIDTTKQVFEEIRRIKPSSLFIAADGPRASHADDKEKCETVRQYVLSGIDWDCSVATLFRDENLGCGRAVSGAITWFFSQVEQGIILEDDCLPSDSFFSYCEVLLNKYKDTDQIMHIAGHNPLDTCDCDGSSYYFANVQHCWGWASWRRAWIQYSFDIHPSSRLKSVNKYFLNRYVFKYWKRIFDSMQRHEINTWDYQWTYCILMNNGICINPAKNLVSNIGFASGAHYSNPEMPTAPRYELDSLVHPLSVELDQKYIKQINEKEYGILYSFFANIKKNLLNYRFFRRLCRFFKLG